MIHRHARTLALSAAIFAASAGLALGQQTAPGEVVTNTLTLQYNSGAGTPQVEIANAASVAFTVDRKLDLLVDAQTATGIRSTVPGETPVILPFFVRNLGNDTEGYVVSVTHGGTIGGGGLTQVTAAPTPGEYAIVLTQNYDPDTFDLGAASFHTPGTAAFNIAPNLAEEEGWYVLIVANVPIGGTNGQFDDFTVTVATADAPGSATIRDGETRNADPMAISIVFADDPSTSSRTGGTLDAAFNGRAADETRLQINAPDVSAVKSFTVLDEGRSDYNCATGAGTALVGAPPALIPGACVQYTITVTNAAGTAVAATSITITDPIPANTSYAGVGTGTFDSVTYDAGDNEVTATRATLAPDTSASFTLRVTID